MDPPDGIFHAPPPWAMKGTMYCFMHWIPAAQAKDFPAEIAYSPLERSSPFAQSAASGKPVGGLASVMILRYDSTPVGAYDEIIFGTGSHSYIVEEGGKRVEKKNMRITRIYVSQKVTCWNGRRDWNCPKHLARFEFNDLDNNAVEIKVFPHDTSGDLTDSAPSDTPFFKTVYRPIRFLPRIPLTTNLAKFIGIDLTVVQPPVPEGQGSQGELAGSHRWCRLQPAMYSSKTGLGWFDLCQKDEGEGEEGDVPNFWPGLGRWQLGIKMDDADISVSGMTWWDAPTSTE